MDRKVETRTRRKFLAVGEACVATCSDLGCSKTEK